MAVYRSQIVKQAQSWIGRNEKSGTHKLIIDIYNTQNPLPRGYKLKYTDAWCAGFVSAVAIKCNATKIIPPECSCNRMIQMLKNIGEWIENDAYIPKEGDLIFYDWDDSGKGENKGEADHVGIVEWCDGSTIKVIEGNYADQVKRRTLHVNGRYIRGFGVPKYDTEPKNVVKIELDELHVGMKGAQVKTMQRLMIASGYKLPKFGADGDFGSETFDVLKNKFQRDHNLVQDGICGNDTWNRLLKG